MNSLRFIIFFAVFLSVFFGMHYFVFTRIADGFALSRKTRAALRIFFLLAALLFVSIEVLTHRGAAPWLKPAADAGYIWLGMLSMAFAAFLCTDVLRVFFRSSSFRYNSALTAIILLALAGSYSIFNVARGPAVKEITIAAPQLPRNLRSFNIVQLSDLHINALTPLPWLENAVAVTNSLGADVIVITGDMIDGDICAKPALCDTLRKLKSRYGVYAVSGNHEIYSRMENFLTAARISNINVIDEKKVLLGRDIQLIGIDDGISALGPKAEKDIEKILSGSPAAGPDIFSVLLSHRPDTFDAAEKLGISLQLSGHTHAGQIPPMDLIVMIAHKYPWGLYRKGNSFAYTTSGTGVWGPPMRLFSRSEIVKIILKGAPEN